VRARVCRSAGASLRVDGWPVVDASWRSLTVRLGRYPDPRNTRPRLQARRISPNPYGQRSCDVRRTKRNGAIRATRMAERCRERRNQDRALGRGAVRHTAALLHRLKCWAHSLHRGIPQNLQSQLKIRPNREPSTNHEAAA
jgi:hypothetical protein